MNIPRTTFASFLLSEVEKLSWDAIAWLSNEIVEYLKWKPNKVTKRSILELRAALFIQSCILTNVSNAGKYSEQYLLMISIPKKKGKPVFDVATLLEALNITAVQRAREKDGQIYFWDKLHQVIHLSVTKLQLELLQTFMDVKIIKNTENVSDEKENNHVLNNAPDLLGEEIKFSFETILKGIQPELDMKESKRGTFAMSMGYSNINSDAYSKNRTSILRTIKPNLVKNTSQINEDARREFGKLALHVSTKVLKSFDLSNHFDLPETEAGKKRKELRKEFGRKLMISDADLDSFKFEGISASIVFNLNPHLDSENDPSKNQSGTITMTHYIPVKIVENKKLKKILAQLNYKDEDSFPFTIIFYSRQCCGSFYNFAKEIEKMQHKDPTKADKIIASSIVQVKGERDYDGRIFDDPSSSFLDRIKHILSSNEDGQYPVKLQYDPMSKWSIVLDMVLRFGCYCTNDDFDSRSDVTAGDVIIICLFCIRVGIHKAVELLALYFERDEMKMEQNNGGEILLREMMTILEDQNITQDDIKDFKNLIFSHCKEAHEVQNKMKSRNTFCDKLQTEIESFSLHPHPTKEEAIDLIQLLSLCGILPLSFLDWCPSHNIEHFFKDPSRIQDFVKEKRNNLKNEFYGSMLRNILLIEKNAESDAPSHSYYSYRTQTKRRMQRFFRLVFTSVYACRIDMLIYPTSKYAVKNTIALGDWKNNKKKNGLIYWKNEIVEESSHLFISKSLKHFFFEERNETTKSKLQNASKEREEISSPAATKVKVTPVSTPEAVNKRRRLPDAHYHYTVMDLLQQSHELDRYSNKKPQQLSRNNGKYNKISRKRQRKIFVSKL